MRHHTTVAGTHRAAPALLEGLVFGLQRIVVFEQLLALQCLARKLALVPLRLGGQLLSQVLLRSATCARLQSGVGGEG